MTDRRSPADGSGRPMATPQAPPAARDASAVSAVGGAAALVGGAPPTAGGAALPEATAIPRGELGERMGIRFVAASPDRIVATMPVVGNRQPFGLLHGGASAVLAESVGSVHATLLAGPGRVAVGVELSCTHHRAATTGTITAVSTPLHVGRLMSTFHIALTDDADRPICTARLTCVSRTAPAPGDAAADRAAARGTAG